VLKGERLKLELPPDANYSAMGDEPAVYFLSPTGVQVRSHWHNAYTLMLKFVQGVVSFLQPIDLIVAPERYRQSFNLSLYNVSENASLKNHSLNGTIPPIVIPSKLYNYTVQFHSLDLADYTVSRNLVVCLVANRTNQSAAIANATASIAHATATSASAGYSVSNSSSLLSLNETASTACAQLLDFQSCRCWNTTPYAPILELLPPEPIGSIYLPRFSAGFKLVNRNSVLRFGRGSCVVESGYIMGPGVVEFTGGSHTILVQEVDSAVVVSGGRVTVESPFFQMTDVHDREDHRYEGASRPRFTLHDGHVNFTAVAPQFLVNGNMLIDGGYLSYPSQNLVSSEYKATRGQLRVVNRFEWNGGTLSGNADLKSAGGMSIGGIDKHLKESWRVINYAEAGWDKGRILAQPGADFVNRGTLETSESQRAELHSMSGVDEGSNHQGPTQFLHSHDAF